MKELFCEGCGRTIEEISGWPHFSLSEKLKVLGRVKGLAYEK